MFTIKEICKIKRLHKYVYNFFLSVEFRLIDFGSCLCLQDTLEFQVKRAASPSCGMFHGITKERLHVFFVTMPTLVIVCQRNRIGHVCLKAEKKRNNNTNIFMHKTSLAFNIYMYEVSFKCLLQYIFLITFFLHE